MKFKFFDKGYIFFSDEFEEYNKVRSEFYSLADDKAIEFEKTYKEELKNLDNVLNSSQDIFFNMIYEVSDMVNSKLISYDIKMYNPKKLIDDNYDKIAKSFMDAYDNICNKYLEAVDDKDFADEHRRSSGNSKLRWQSFYHGLDGDIIDNKKKWIKKLISVSINNKKQKIFLDEELFIPLFDGVYYGITNMADILVEILMDNGVNIKIPNKADYDRVDKLLEEAKNAITDDVRLIKYKEILKLNPYDLEMYMTIVKEFGDSLNQVSEIADHYGFNIDSFKKDLIDETFENKNLEDEKSAIASKNELISNCEFYGVQREYIEEYLKEYDEVLERYDKEYRNVDGHLFEKREEASIARYEYENIVEILKGIDDGSEKSIRRTIAELESRNFESVISEKYLKELHTKLIEVIKREDAKVLKDNFIVPSLKREKDADDMINEVIALHLRSEDLVRAKIVEIRKRKDRIIYVKDKRYINKRLSELLILNDADIRDAIIFIKNLNVRSIAAKNEEILLIKKNQYKILRKHRSLVNKAVKHEERIYETRYKKVRRKKGMAKVFERAVEITSSMAAEMSAKSDKEAWIKVTKNGKISVNELRHKFL